jgi:hypothetical protein
MREQFSWARMEDVVLCGRAAETFGIRTLVLLLAESGGISKRKETAEAVGLTSWTSRDSIVAQVFVIRTNA